MRKRSVKREYDEEGTSIDDKEAQPFAQARLPALPSGYNWRTIPKWPSWRYVVPTDKDQARFDAEFHRIMWVCCLRGKLAAGLIPEDRSSRGYWLSKQHEKAEIIALLTRRRMKL